MPLFKVEKSLSSITLKILKCNKIIKEQKENGNTEDLDEMCVMKVKNSMNYKWDSIDVIHTIL